MKMKMDKRCLTTMTSILLTMELTLTMMWIKWMTLIKTEKADHSIDRPIIWEQQIMIKNK